MFGLMKGLHVSFLEAFGRTKTAWCGHEARQVSYVSARWKHRTYEKTIYQPRSIMRWVRYCPDCLAQMTIQCGWCDTPIFIGDRVSIQPHPQPGTYPVPKHAAVYSMERQQYVGCMEHHEPREDPQEDRAQRGLWLPLDGRIETRNGPRWVGAVSLASRPHVKLVLERPPLEYLRSYGTLRR